MRIPLKSLAAIIIASLAPIGFVSCDNDSGSSSEQSCSPECNDDQTCDNGSCVPKSNTPKTCDPECNDDQTCDNGSCVPKSNSPKTCDPECNDDQTCDNGSCVPKSDSHEECNPDVDNECVSGEDEAPEEIACSPECGENQVCVNGECITMDDPVQPEDQNPPSLTVLPPNGLTTVQGMVDAQFSVSLSKQPKKDVVISVKSTNPAIGTPSSESLTFTAENWNDYQTVNIAATKETQKNDSTTYAIVIGPTQSEDPNFNNLSAIEIEVTHHNKFTSSENDEITLDKNTEKLFLRKGKPGNPSAAIDNTATFKATLKTDAKDKTITWNCINLTDNVSCEKLVIQSNIDDSEPNTSVLTLKRIDYALNSPENINDKLDYYRKIQISACHGDRCASAVVELKPYLPAGMSYTYINKNIRTLNGAKSANILTNDNPGGMECGYYDEATTQVFNYDMIHDYVEPVMYKAKDGKLYPTRASVAAAARFLVTQFPKSISYAGQNDFRDFAKEHNYTTPYTHSSYDWAKSYDKTAPGVENYRVFGLNLTDTAYNNTSFSDKDIIKKEGIPWNCSYKNFYPVEMEKNYHNGLRCTGFVTWAYRNGMFGLADVYADVFGQVFTKDNSGNYTSTRKYTNQKSGSTYKGSTTYRDFDEVYEKLTRLEESDFVLLSDLDDKNTHKIKAGDILWYLGYTCENGQKCPEECKAGGGHFALVLGITYNDDKTVKYYYVAEAAALGNLLTPHTPAAMKNWDKPKNDAWGITFQTGDNCRERRVIKMDRVFNYYSDKIKDTDPDFDANTYKYTDMWW